MEIIKPLSKRRRVTQLVFLIVVFLVFGPVLVLMSSGYSFKDVLSLSKIKLLKTGGIYVAEIGANSSVVLDNKTGKESSFLDRTVLFQGLSTDLHTIKVKRQGYREWSKSVSVYPNRVTEIRPVLIKENPKTGEVLATSTNLALKAILSSEQKTATSTFEFLEKKNYSVDLKNRDIVIAWKSADDSPYYLCTFNECLATTTVSVSEDIVDYEWFQNRNDAMIVLSEGAVFVVELDPRNGRIIVPILKIKDLPLSKTPPKNVKTSLLSYNDSLYIYHGGLFFELDL